MHNKRGWGATRHRVGRARGANFKMLSRVSCSRTRDIFPLLPPLSHLLVRVDAPTYSAVRLLPATPERGAWVQLCWYIPIGSINAKKITNLSRPIVERSYEAYIMRGSMAPALWATLSSTLMSMCWTA
jgi:hypothetical protein